MKKKNLDLMINNLKIFFSNPLIIILLILFCFFLMRNGSELPILIFPFLLFYLLKTNPLSTSLIYFYIIGMHYFLILFYWGNLLGARIVIFGTLLTGLCFLIVALLSSYLIKNSKTLLFQITTLPVMMYLMKETLFAKFIEVSSLLNLPVVLGPLYSIVGPSTINFLLWTFSICIGCSIIFNNKKLLTLSLISFLILTSPVFFIHLNSLNSDPNSQTITVASLQGNFNQSFNYRKKITYSHIIPYYYNESLKQAKNGADIIVWPEYAIPLDISYDKNTKELLKNLSKNYNTTLIIGSFKSINSQTQDLAYVITPENGFEVPYVSQKPFTDVEGLGDEYFVFGDKNRLYKTQVGNFFILICYEELYRDIVESYPLEEVDMIFIIANNQRLGHELSYDTLLWNMQDLAASYSRDVISSTNTGPTAHVNSIGKVIKKAKYNSQDTIITQVEIKEKPRSVSFHTHYKDIIIHIIILFYIILLFREIKFLSKK